MEDWEDEPVPQVLKKAYPRSNWDDEDADEDGVKESWEDEDEPAPAPEPASASSSATSVRKVEAKLTDKEGTSMESAQDKPLDPVAEKLWQQRLVEEADYRSTTELFAKRGDENLDNFIPKSEDDFLQYAELVTHKLRPYEKSYHYTGLLKAVMRLSMTSLKAADAKEVASSVTAIANEKLKAEKEVNAGKKKAAGTKKTQLHVDKPDDDVVLNAYDDLDDDDFM